MHLAQWEPDQGHADHFLSRLSRISNDQAETALELYYDTELLRFVIAGCNIPDGARRVAISLRDAHRGPFVIVTREGHFVTCLGRDMSPGSTPVIPLHELQRLSAQLERYRRQVAHAKKTAAPYGGVARLLDRLEFGAETLCREEFNALRHVLPIYGHELEGLTKTLTEAIQQVRDAIATYHRPGVALTRSLVRTYARCTWALANLEVLGAAFLKERGTIGDERETVTTPLLVGDGVIPIAARILWAGCAVGTTVDACEAALTSARSPRRVLDGMLALSAAAVAAPERREQARALMATAARDLSRRLVPRDAAAVVERTQRALDAVLARPEAALEAQRQHGVSLALSLARNMAPGAAHRYTRPEHVPRDLALSLAAAEASNLFVDADAPRALATLLPWLVRATPKELYLPAGIIEAMTPHKPQALWAAVRSREECEHEPQEVRSTADPSRKQPCPCGSGRKYKRCCGDRTVPPPRESGVRSVPAVERCA